MLDSKGRREMLLRLAAAPEVLASGTPQFDPDGAVTAVSLEWPDGATGEYIADAISHGAVDAYHVTHVLDGVTTTYTQPAVTRDKAGTMTHRPALVVS